ncbi:MAG: SDR family NAD(P)-dependent oxidoreductase [Actinobacteria bacterium]|nr:SDR family NAD(P)-dependent oxidoreductase [Actinomycetota bacterium]
MSNSPVAIVTGASRGIGRAGALALAEAGFDVVVSARTVREGEGVAEPNSVREETTLAVPGSLERTAQEIEERGQRALIVPMDLIDVASLKALPATVMAEWGRIDVLFNNAIFRGVGTLDRIADLTIESMTNLLAGNFMNQILLIQEVIPHMLAAGGGTIIDMVSGSARLDPAGPPGEGGWGILYSASKAAFGRVAGGVNAEYRAKGIKAFNVDPGNVVTEARKAAKPDDEYSSGYGSEPAEATGKVVAWLASDPTSDKFLGKWIFAPKLCSDLGLLPGWTFQAPQ